MPANYEIVINGVVAKIASGEYPPGHQLPSIRLLAEEYGVSKTAVVDALRAMRREGVIRTHPGKATYVADRRITD